MYNVIITNMTNANIETLEFDNYKEAKREFISICEKHNIHVSGYFELAAKEIENECGGRGHDFRIELLKN